MVGLSADLPNGKREWDDLAIGEILILREGWIALTVSPTAKSVTSLPTALTILSRGLNAIRLMHLCWAGPDAPSRRLHRPDSQRRNASRPARDTADQVRNGDQPQDGEGARPHRPGVGPCPR